MDHARPGWDRTWLDSAAVFARRSLCVNSQVGAVAVSHDNRYSWHGYNGPPRGLRRDTPCSNWCPRASGKGSGTSDYSACASIHAEVNALLRSDASLLFGGTLYVTRAPCINCARVVANSGVHRVVWEKNDEDDLERVGAVVGHLMACEIEPLVLSREAA